MFMDENSTKLAKSEKRQFVVLGPKLQELATRVRATVRSAAYEIGKKSFASKRNRATWRMAGVP